MIRRREFSRQTKRDAWDRSGGFCEPGRVPQMPDVGCGARLASGNIFYEHVNCDGTGGDPTLDNCCVLCRTCWRVKTRVHDQPRVAKTKRQGDLAKNIRMTPRQALLGTVASGVRKGFDGTPRWRDSGRRWPMAERKGDHDERR